MKVKISPYTLITLVFLLLMFAVVSHASAPKWTLIRGRVYIRSLDDCAKEFEDVYREIDKLDEKIYYWKMKIDAEIDALKWENEKEK